MTNRMRVSIVLGMVGGVLLVAFVFGGWGTRAIIGLNGAGLAVAVLDARRSGE